MRRLLLILACLLVLIFVAAPFVIAWVAVYTEAGAQFLVRRVPRQIGDVGLESVEIDHPLVHLTFTDIDGRLAPAPLLLQTIRVPQGHLASALIQAKRRTRPATPSQPVFLPHWLLISVEQASVDHVVITAYNGVRLEGSGINGAAVIRSHVIRLFQADGM